MEEATVVKAPDPRIPVIEEARKAPSFMCELSSEVLYLLAEQGSQDATKERLIRNIMAVEGITWYEARQKLSIIKEENAKLLWLITLPHKIGILIGLTSAGACFPLVFGKSAALYFNRMFVTMELPPPQDMETWLEIGSWSWNWMEPVLGTATFCLLAMQFVRSQLNRISFQPYTGWVKNRRARKLAETFPQYNRDIIMDFSLTAALSSNRHVHLEPPSIASLAAWSQGGGVSSEAPAKGVKEKQGQ